MGAPHGAVAHNLTNTVSSPIGHIEMPAIRPEIQAIHAIIAAREEDPLIAALRTLKTALEVGAFDLAVFRSAFGLP